MRSRRGEKELRRYRWFIFAVIGAGYVLAYFHRVSTAVVAPELTEAFHASGALLGVLASAYFYPYALMQLPAGLLSDSLGPRRAVTLFTLMASFGAVFFGLSPTVSFAILARILVGLGVAVIFIPGMKIFAEWYLSRHSSCTAHSLPRLEDGLHHHWDRDTTLGRPFVAHHSGSS